MSKDISTLNNLLKFLRDGRRPGAGDRAFVVHISKLERYFRESGYKREAGGALKQLVRSGAKSFILEAGDMFVVTRQSPEVDLSRAVRDIHRCYRDSEMLTDYQPHMLCNDRFFTWFDLETGLEAFEAYIHDWITARAEGRDDPQDIPFQAVSPQALEKFQSPLQPRDTPQAEAIELWFGYFRNADLAPYTVSQPIEVRLPGGAAQVMLRRLKVKPDIIFRSLTGLELTQGWQALLVREACLPVVFAHLVERKSGGAVGQKKETESGADDQVTVIPLAISYIVSAEFGEQCARLSEADRKKILIEVSLVDVMGAGDTFEQAHKLLSGQHIRLVLGDVLASQFGWLDFSGGREAFPFDFVRLIYDAKAGQIWSDPLSDAHKSYVRKINAFGRGRFFLAGYLDGGVEKLAQSVQITLFEDMSN